MRRTLAIVAMGTSLLAQAPPPTDSPVIRSNVVNVQVPVTVTDKKGRAVTNLTSKDFELLDGDVAQSFTLDVASHPVSLVVAVQANSGARQSLAQVQKASALLVPLVAGENGDVAVLSFDQQVLTLTPFTTRADDIQLAFKNLRVGNGLHRLNDAALEGIRLLNTRATNRKKILLLISEATDEGSEITTRDVFTKAELDGILIYAVTMKTALPERSTRPKNPQPPEARAPLPMGGLQTATTDVQNGGYGTNLKDVYEVLKGLTVHSSLDAYATLTGGSQQKFSDQNDLEDAIAKIGREIHNQYLLTFAPRQPAPGYHPITVKVLGQSKLNLRARRGYNVAADTTSGPTPTPKVR